MKKMKTSHAKSHDTAIIQGEHYRFTILTSRLIRAEYSENGLFEDRPTQMVQNREFPVPEYKVFEKENSLEIVTDHVSVTYDKSKFTSHGLVFRLRGNFSAYHSIWNYGDETQDLKGTARTLDMIDGATELEAGILSRFGFSVIDDSQTAALTEDGWYDQRANEIDFYYFGYGLEYKLALADYYKLTGPQPLLPRYTLGNWWSRFYKYTEASYMTLMERFYEQKIPFSVAVIDMDWHVVEVPEKYGSGWTGYTWNQELFPEPERFLKWLKQHNYKVTLNVHPADGIRPFEENYLEMAKELGLDWENEEFIQFDVTNREFLKAYFEFIHHPNEEKGVDFWWVDWQQGSGSPAGVDPLWVLNHYHYHDIQRDGNIGITFSRYAGPGSHRYPIGFSGDTVISWESLAFQPYFTATASNIGYGWWSHDIGGHMWGYRDNELSLRWLQYGVFSPIMRLHSSSSEFLGKEPWNYPQPYSNVMADYLRLRHRLIPYLYNMNHKAHEESLPLIRPMYYEHPNLEVAYNLPNQYYFGDDLLVMPLTEKAHPNTLKAEFKGWLPEGFWYDLQSGLVYAGDRSVQIYRGLDKMGLFAKAGAIIPLTSFEENFDNDTDNPADLEVLVFTGADGELKLIEDEADLTHDSLSAYTRVEYQEQQQLLTVHPAEGNTSVLPEERNWQFTFYGLQPNDAISIISGEQQLEAKITFDESLNATVVKLKAISTSQKVTIDLSASTKANYVTTKQQLAFDYLNAAQIEYLLKEQLFNILNTQTTMIGILSEFETLNIEPAILQPLKEILWTVDAIE